MKEGLVRTAARRAPQNPQRFGYNNSYQGLS